MAVDQERFIHLSKPLAPSLPGYVAGNAPLTVNIQPQVRFWCDLFFFLRCPSPSKLAHVGPCAATTTHEMMRTHDRPYPFPWPPPLLLLAQSCYLSGQLSIYHTILTPVSSHRI